MNFNIANLGSLPNDHVPANGSQFDLANVGAKDDDHFAHMLRDEGSYDEQASLDARERDAHDARDARDAIEREDSRDDDADHEARADSEDGDDREDPDELDNDNENEQAETSGGNNEQHGDATARQGLLPEHVENRGEAVQDRSTQPEAQTARSEQGADNSNNEQQAVGNAGLNGEQAADAARAAAAAAVNQPKAAETLINLANRDGATPVQGPQAGQPNSPDILAAASLPKPMLNKQGGVNAQGDGSGKDNGSAQQFGQQVQAAAKQQATPHLRGGRIQHGGDIQPNALPRLQSGPGAFGANMGVNMGVQPSGPTAPSPIGAEHAANPANLNGGQSNVGPNNTGANAANVASVASTDGGAAIENLQLTVSAKRTGQADLPVLTLRPDTSANKPANTPPNMPNGAPTNNAAPNTPMAPTSAVPQPLAPLPMDGEGGFNATGLGDDGSKGSSNAASSSGSSTDSTAAGSKVSNVIQQTAASDIRSPGIQVAMQLSKAAQNGIDKLSIRLDPAELGRVDIKLEVGHDGRVIALVAAERPETLELLKSDARALERALQEAGLETDAGSLSFSLSQGDQQNGAMADNGADHGTGNGSGNGGNGDGEGANGDEAAEDSNVLPHVVSNRALDISV